MGGRGRLSEPRNRTQPNVSVLPGAKSGRERWEKSARVLITCTVTITVENGWEWLLKKVVSGDARHAPRLTRRLHATRIQVSDFPAL